MGSRKKAFTLVELLAVIAIIGILAGFIFTAAEKAIQRARITATKEAIGSLSMALTSYEHDMGSFDAELKNGDKMPTGLVNDATKREKLVRILTGKTRVQTGGSVTYQIDRDVRETPDWSGPYFDPKEKELNDKGELIDAWGHPLMIRIKIGNYDDHLKHRPDSFEIYSFGPNELDDGGNSKGRGAQGGLADDINNWE